MREIKRQKKRKNLCQFIESVRRVLFNFFFLIFVVDFVVVVGGIENEFFNK